MKLFIYLLYFLFVVYFITKDSGKFILLIFLGLLFLPALKIGSIYIAPTYFIVIFLFIGILLIKKLNLAVNFRFAIYFIANLAYLLIATAGWVINAKISTTSVIPFIGSLLALFILVGVYLYVKSSNISIHRTMDEFIRVFVILNFIVIILQIAFPVITTTFLHEIYFKPSMPVYDALLEFVQKFGFNNRMFGLFPTPLYLGATMLLLVAYKLPKVIEYRMKKDVMLIVLILACGFASLSKMFILGIFLVVFAQIAVLFFYGIKRKIFDRIVKYVLLLFATGAGFFFVMSLTPFKSFLFYYFSFVFKPFEALRVRYTGDDDLFLKETYALIEQFPIFGVGPGAYANEFIGDSTYVTIAHNSGLFGLFVLLLMIIIIFFQQIKKSNTHQIMLLIAFLIISLGLNTFFTNVIFVPFVFLLLKDVNPRLNES